MNKNEYFAKLTTEEAARAILGKTIGWNTSLSTSNYIEKCKNSWRCYHGVYFQDLSSGHQLSFGGEQGELAQLAVNHFRNIAVHLLNMTTANRPSMEARSTNTDFKSLVQTKLANGLLDYYVVEKRLEEYLKRAAEYAIVLGEGYVKVEWDSTGGEPYGFNEETQTTIFEGDIKFSNLSPLDVVRDTSREDQDHDWVIVRVFRNRYELIAKYPDFEEEIMGVESKDDQEVNNLFGGLKQDKTDLIPVYEFYHRRSDALPDGRYMIIITPKAVAYDGPLPYRFIPIFRMAPSDILGTPLGYTPMFDVIPLQETVNALYSTVATNQNAFGVQNILIPKGANLNTNELSGGLNVIEYEQGMDKPQALNLTQTPPEIFNFIRTIENQMETLSGINSVVRGNPEASLKSGAALALVQAQAVQFASGLQQSYVRLMEDVGTAIIKLLQDFATTPRVASIVGKSNKSYVKQFKGEDLLSINRVKVTVANPLSKCLKKDTPVLMANGSIKKVQDIKIGDQVMGPDSKPRTVQQVNTGIEEMFDIYTWSEKGKEEFIYGCNRSHILSLKYCASRKHPKYKKGEIYDISVDEYLKLPKSTQRLFMGFRTGIEFEEKQLDLPAYQLGLWLGDGHSDRLTVTTMDQEIEDSWKLAANDLGYNTYVYNQSETVKQIGFAKTANKQHREILHDLGLYKNKHIPDLYKYNSRSNRLDLLAGILDTDATLIDEQTFVLSQKDDNLSNDIVYLARSLGFKVNHKKFKAKCQNNFVGEYNKVTIGGKTWEIPTKLERKKAKIRELSRDYLNYGIKLKSTGIGIYYGFTLEEEPHFLLGDFTVTHNTTAGRLEIANNLIQMGLIQNVDDYFTVLNTGSIETMTDSAQNQLFLIRAENERLADMQEVKVLPTDQHVKHIEAHASILNDPDLRMNDELAGIVLNHIQEHIDLLKTINPELLMILKQQPLSPDQQQGPPPGAPEENPTLNRDEANFAQNLAENVQQPLPVGVEQANQVRQPNMPTPPPPFQNLPTNPADVPPGGLPPTQV